MIWPEYSLFYLLGTAVTLWAACGVYLAPLDKQPRWRFRAAVLLAAGAGAAAVIRLIPFHSSWLTPVVYFFFAVFFFLACADGSLPAALYCGVWALISQLLVSETFHLLHWYGASRLSLRPWVWLSVALFLFSSIYCVIALTVARWMPVEGKYAVGPRQLTLVLLLLLIFLALRQLLTADLSSANSLYPVTVVLAQYYCASMLYFQYTLFSKSAIKQELAILNRLWYEQKEQYRLARENIAIINRKCHDLKHQIAALRTMSGHENQEKYLREVEDSVRIYDSILKTGNEVLDTVLTEKNLYCEANGIRVTCVADGRRLNFMDPVDIYSMLGNAMDNAIEAVQRPSDPEKRMIDILICAEKQFLLLRISNPLEEPPVFHGGLPVSTKAPDGYHGFGLKSIFHTARKYGGHAAVTADNGFFVLKVLLPLDPEG